MIRRGAKSRTSCTFAGFVVIVNQKGVALVWRMGVGCSQISQAPLSLCHSTMFSSQTVPVPWRKASIAGEWMKVGSEAAWRSLPERDRMADEGCVCVSTCASGQKALWVQLGCSLYLLSLSAVFVLMRACPTAFFVPLAPAPSFLPQCPPSYQPRLCFYGQSLQSISASLSTRILKD